MEKQTSKESFHVCKLQSGPNYPNGKSGTATLLQCDSARLPGTCHPQGSYVRAVSQRFFTSLTSMKVSRIDTVAKSTLPLPVPGFLLHSSPTDDSNCCSRCTESRNFCHWTMSTQSINALNKQWGSHEFSEISFSEISFLSSLQFPSQ